MFMLLCYTGHGQFYSRGQDPASVRWKQIKTPHFQVIFPENYVDQGAYVADVLEYAYEHAGSSLGHSPRRVPVIIHTQTVVPNGFVSWAPRRLEMFANPPQDIDGHDWLESLAVHEFRHVVQVDKLHQGITRILSYLFGEQATGAVLGMFVPLWFLEGDAVVTETALTNSGRGRMPAFEQGLRAQVLEKGIYSYDKATLGSLRDYVPNHYELGYQLVANARKQYGGNVWDGVLTHVARKPYSLFPFTIGLKRHAGVFKVRHYRQTMAMLDTAWTWQRQQYEYSVAEAASPSHKLYTSYRYHDFLDDTTMMAFRTGMADIPRLVQIGPGNTERVLFTPGIVNAHAFSTNGRYIVWSEQRTDPRWAHRSWSEIHLYDTRNGRHTRLTKGTRYFSPAISPDGSLIAAAAVNDNNEYSIVVIGAANGNLIREYNTPENSFLMTPSWHENNFTLVAVALDEDGKRLVVTDKELGGFTTIYHAGHTEISRPRFYQPDAILFNGAFTGTDNVYSLDVTTGEVEQLVSSPYGAVDAVPSPGGGLTWSDYASSGYRIMSGAMPEKGIRLEETSDHSLKFHELLARQEGSVVKKSNIPRKDYLAIPYYKAGNLFRFHSWGPVSIDADNMEGNPGASLLSQNVLSTSFATVGYEYDLNERLGRYYMKYRYEGFYPKMEIAVGSGIRRSLYRDNQGNIHSFLWTENTMKFGLNLPLTFQRKAWFSGITPFLFAGVNRVLPNEDSPSFFKRNDIKSLEYRLFAFNQYRTVARDIRPRWAQIIDVNYRHTPFAGGDMGQIFSGRLILYTPGLGRFHSLRLGAAYQQRQEGEKLPQTLNFGFGDMVVYPRGISLRNDDKVWVYSGDYSFPLFYPDWSIPQLVFIQRFSANLFYDYALARYRVPGVGETMQHRQDELYAAGADLIARVHLFRFVFPFDLGIRFYTHTGAGKMQFQLLGSVNL